MSGTQDFIAQQTEIMKQWQGGQQPLVNLAYGYQRAVNGMMNMAIHQMEIGRDLIGGAFEDLDLLVQAQTPDAMAKAEIDIFQRRSKRALAVWQRMTEQMRQDFSLATEQPEAMPNGAAGQNGTAAATAPARATGAARR